MCLATDDRGGPCRCSADARARVEASQHAVDAAGARVEAAQHEVDDAVREIHRLRVLLSQEPDTLETSLAKRPDLSATIHRFHDAGFSMRVADDISDPDNQPMLVIGTRAPAGAAGPHDSGVARE